MLAGCSVEGAESMRTEHHHTRLQAIKFQSPHVVDHGPENIRSPDGALYMVASGCLSPDGKASPNCTWISGDGVFVARANGFTAAHPASLNDPNVWQYWAGGGAWADDVAEARPVVRWKGRCGAVTATWHPTHRTYLIVVTAPTDAPASINGPCVIVPCFLTISFLAIASRLPVRL